MDRSYRHKIALISTNNARVWIPFQLLSSFIFPYFENQADYSQVLYSWHFFPISDFCLDLTKYSIKTGSSGFKQFGSYAISTRTFVVFQSLGYPNPSELPTVRKLLKTRRTGHDKPIFLVVHAIRTGHLVVGQPRQK